jgi:Amidohydrolase family
MTFPNRVPGRGDGPPDRAPGLGEGGAWLLSGGRVVTPDGVLSPGWIRVTGELIDAVGPGSGRDQQASGVTLADVRGRWVLPGFIDLHVHGGGGTSFTEGAAEDAKRAAQFHRGHGSTTMLASLVTASAAELEARAAMLAGLAADGVIAGIHLEGPFLSPGQARRPGPMPHARPRRSRLRAPARRGRRAPAGHHHRPGAVRDGRGHRGGGASRGDGRRRAHRRHRGSGVLRHAVAAGLPVADVAAAASTAPARVLGIGDRTGAVRPCLAAGLVVCDENFGLRAAMAGGWWLRYQWLEVPGSEREPARCPPDVSNDVSDRHPTRRV